MKYVEFRRHLGKAGLSVGDFAQLLGVKATSVSNYSSAGMVPRTYALLAVLLGDLVDNNGQIRELLTRHGVPMIAANERSNVHLLETFRSERDRVQPNTTRRARVRASESLSKDALS